MERTTPSRNCTLLFTHGGGRPVYRARPLSDVLVLGKWECERGQNWIKSDCELLMETLLRFLFIFSFAWWLSFCDFHLWEKLKKEQWSLDTQTLLQFNCGEIQFAPTLLSGAWTQHTTKFKWMKRNWGYINVSLLHYVKGWAFEHHA